MSCEPSVAEQIRALVRRRAVLAGGAGELADELPLGEGGLGMDSIALAELLLDCERLFGIRRPVELLDGPPLTVGRLAAHVAAAGTPSI